MKRTGPKGSGQFAPISWDQALVEIAERWKAIIADCGAEAILPYSYAGTMGIVQHDALHGLFYRLGASELDRTICAPAKGQGFKDVMGSTMPTAPQEAQDSDCIFLWSLHMVTRISISATMSKRPGAKGPLSGVLIHTAIRRLI